MTGKEQGSRRERGVSLVPQPEQQARNTIDQLLAAAGWLVCDADRANIHAARGVAIREFPLKAGHGFADYLLYVDGKVVGVIEAKKEGATLTGVETQSAKYTKGLPDGLPRWANPLPFSYQSTGTDKSAGQPIWSRKARPKGGRTWMCVRQTRFTNGLDPAPRPGVFYVYAIKCDDDSIYIGHTDNLARRWEEHLAGQAADWTKQHKPIQIVHYEEYPSRQEAADREKWLKTGYGRKWIKREIEAGRARQVGYETGAQLLQRILETRRSQWLARADKAGGKGKAKYKEPAAPDTIDLPELPEGWVWGTFGHLCRIQGGYAFRSGDYQPQGVPLVRISNLVNGSVQLEEDTVFLPEAFLGELGESR